MLRRDDGTPFFKFTTLTEVGFVGSVGFVGFVGLVGSVCFTGFCQNRLLHSTAQVVISLLPLAVRFLSYGL